MGMSGPRKAQTAPEIPNHDQGACTFQVLLKGSKKTVDNLQNTSIVEFVQNMHWKPFNAFCNDYSKTQLSLFNPYRSFLFWVTLRVLSDIPIHVDDARAPAFKSAPVSCYSVLHLFHSSRPFLATFFCEFLEGSVTIAN